MRPKEQEEIDHITKRKKSILGIRNGIHKGFNMGKSSVRKKSKRISVRIKVKREWQMTVQGGFLLITIYSANGMPLRNFK